MMKAPGLRSLVVKSPLWPFAGWDGALIGVIFTRVQGPLGVSWGMVMASSGRV